METKTDCNFKSHLKILDSKENLGSHTDFTKNNTKATRKGTRVGKLHNHTILRKLNQKDHIT